MRACAARKTEEELQSETGDEDRPEMEPEPQTNTELEGLFVSLFFRWRVAPSNVFTILAFCRTVFTRLNAESNQ